ncbi:MAG TPA: trypsin-like peptidase domain-containing protein [Pseudonocardiaceae bacterium]
MAGSVSDAAIVALHGPDGPVGLGFLAADDTVVTCAHVVCRALDLPDNHVEEPTEPVTVEFLLSPHRPRLTAQVVAWRPYGSEAPDDVAVLRLAGRPPRDATPVPLLDQPLVWGNQVRIFGVPDGYDDGVWATGQLLGRQAGGLVQVNDDHTTGFGIQAGFSGSPVWDDELGAVVGMVVAAAAPPDLRTGFVVPSQTLLDIWPPLRAPTTPVPPSPYRGLQSFREEDAALFFGRDVLAEDVARAVRLRPVNAVVGPSGYGKSSLIAAGVLPRLRRQHDLAIAGPVRPGSNARHEIAGALLELLEPGMSVAAQLKERPVLAESLTEDRLREVVDEVLRRTGKAELLLVIDQLEEALDPDAVDALDALAPLIQLALDPAAPLRVLLAIRSDFLDRALARPELAAGLRAVETVGAMTTDQLRAAVTGPLPEGFRFEDELDSLIVTEVRHAPGQLPLLQFVLNELWQRQVNRMLTHQAYRELGGVSGALARYAEEHGWNRLTEQERVVARRMFTQLVRVEPDLPPTRRAVRRSELGEEAWQLAQRMVAARLLVSGRRETVELAHEALITHWDRLREWVEQNREFQIWKEGFRELVEQWQRSGRSEPTLLSKEDLAKARYWGRRRAEDLTPDEREFLHSALRARYQRQVARFGQPAALIIITFLIGFLTWTSDTVDNPAEKLASNLPAQHRNTPEVLHKVLTAYNTDPADETVLESLFEQYLDTYPLELVLTEPGFDGTLDHLATSADGSVLVTGSAKGATLWRSVDGQKVPTTLQLPAPDDIAVSPDGTIIAVGANRRIHLLDNTGRELTSITVAPHGDGPPAPLTVAVGNDAVAAWLIGEELVRVWDLDGKQLGEVPVGQVMGVDLWLAQGSRLVVRVVESGEIRTGDFRSGQLHTVEEGSQVAAVNAAGTTLATCRRVGEEHSLVRVRSLTEQHQVTEHTWRGDYCGFLHLDPQGTHLVLPYRSSYEVLVYDVTAQQSCCRYHPVSVTGSVPPPVAAVVTAPGGLRALHLGPQSVYVHAVPFDQLDTYPPDTRAGAVHPDGTYLATSWYHADSGRSVVTLWRSQDHRAAERIIVTGMVSQLEFAPRGDHLAVGFADRHDVEIHEVPSLRLVHTLSFPAQENLAPPLVRFDDRGHVLTSHGGQLSVWDLATGQQVGAPLPAPAPDGLGGAVPFTALPGSSRVVVVSPNRHGLDVTDLDTHRTTRVPVEDVVTVVATPAPGRVLLFRRQADRSVLELWDLNSPQPAGKLLFNGLHRDMPGEELRALVGFDPTRRWIVLAREHYLYTWDYDGEPRWRLDAAGSPAALAIAGGIALARDFSGAPLAAISLNPETWKRHLCSLIGNPERAELTNLPSGVGLDDLRTTGLCTTGG